MRGIAWIVLAVALAPGCFETPQTVLDDIVCGHVCSCVVVADCEDLCLGQLAPVTQECFDEVTTNAQNCSLVIDAFMSGGVCQPAVPVPAQ